MFQKHPIFVVSDQNDRWHEFHNKPIAGTLSSLWPISFEINDFSHRLPLPSLAIMALQQPLNHFPVQHFSGERTILIVDQIHARVILVNVKKVCE